MHPLPSIRQLCKPSGRPKGDSGASVFPSKPGHSGINPRKSTPILLNTVLPGKPQTDQWQEHACQDPWWINGEKQERALMKEPWGLAAKYNCPFLKAVCAGVGSDSSERGASLGPTLAMYSLIIMHHGLVKDSHGEETLSLTLKLKISPMYVTWLHVLFGFVSYFVMLGGRKNFELFFFFLLLSHHPPFFIRMKPLKVTKATAIQANRKCCVVKLKQMQSIINLAPTIF